MNIILAVLGGAIAGGGVYASTVGANNVSYSLMSINSYHY